MVFDAFGTLVNVFSVAKQAEAVYPGNGENIACGTRDKQVEYTRLVAMADPDSVHGSRHHKSFSDITAAALRYTLARLGLDESGLGGLADAYEKLESFPDVEPVLARLHAAGVKTAVLSNGDPGALARLLAHARLTEHLDQIISASEARTFKIAPSVYGLVSRHFPHPEAPVVFVSSNGWDIVGAGWFGFQTFWLNRAGLPAETIGPAPDHVGRSMFELLDVLGIHIANH